MSTTVTVFAFSWFKNRQQKPIVHRSWWWWWWWW